MLFRQTHPWILGSSSPRRKTLLTILGFQFSVSAPNTDETPRKAETPRDYVRRICREKGEEVAKANPSFRGLIISADTAVFLGDTILGKPENADHAFETLRLLNGKRHEVHTAYRVLHAGGGEAILRSVATGVQFFKLPEAALKAYALTEDPLDKAGAYSLQGPGTFLVKSVVGSFNNVIGFPVEDFVQTLLAKNWLTPLSGPPAAGVDNETSPHGPE